MFLRVLMWVVLIAAAWWFIKPRPKGGARMPPPGAPPAGTAPPAAPRRAIAQAEPMVDCARCGLHFPASEAVRDGNSRVFCCVEHRAAGPRGPA